MVPLQVLDALIRPVYETLAPQQTSSPRLAIHTHQLEGTATYSPTIDKVMSHTWRNTAAHSESAAKSDDAVIPTYIWDTRISSVYPMITSSCLNTFRRVLLGYRSKQIY